MLETHLASVNNGPSLVLQEHSVRRDSKVTLFYINKIACFEQNKPFNWLQSLSDTLVLDCFSPQFKIICTDFLTKPSLWNKKMITSLCMILN